MTNNNADIEDFGDSGREEGIHDDYDEDCLKEEDSPCRVETEDGDSKNKDLVGHTQWAYYDKDVFTPARITRDKLAPGYYTVNADNKGNLYYRKKHLETDEILDFKHGISKMIIEEIQDFWKLKDKFKEFNFVHRRGFLMYGPAGSGKTMTTNLIVKDIIERDGIVITCAETSLFSPATEMLREVEPDRKIVCIFEDVDTMVERKHDEDALLRFLDGDNQIGNILNIATTNYPEKLDKRIVARPRRFDRVIKVGMPEKEVREEYLKKKLAIKGKELDKWTIESEGLSFAALADLVISVKCLGNNFDDSLEKLKKLCKSGFSSDEYYEGSVGFGN